MKVNLKGTFERNIRNSIWEKTQGDFERNFERKHPKTISNANLKGTFRTEVCQGISKGLLKEKHERQLRNLKGNLERKFERKI